MATAPYTAVMAVCFSVLATAAAFGGNPLAHPALNPVTPLPTPSHPPVTLVSGGVPQFVLMWDSAAARTRDASGREFRSVRESVRTLRREIGLCTGKEVEVVDTGGTPVSQLRARRLATPNEVQAQRPATPKDVRAVIFVGAPDIDPSSLPPEGFVVTTAEVDQVMFGRAIHPPSFVWAFVMTLVFSAISMLLMLPKLAKVDMVESLKSNE